MKQIILESKTHGIDIVFVDDEDYDYLNQWEWKVWKNKNVSYARRYCGRLNGKQKELKMHRVILGLNKSNQLCDHIDQQRVK